MSDVITGWKFIQKDRTSKNGNHKWRVRKWYKHDGELELWNEVCSKEVGIMRTANSFERLPRCAMCGFSGTLLQVQNHECKKTEE